MSQNFPIWLSILAVLLSVSTSFRISRFLFQRWELEDRDNRLFSIVSSFIVGLGMAYVSAAAVQYFGLSGALLSAVAAIPLSCFVWFYLIGTCKAFERVLRGVQRSI